MEKKFNKAFMIIGAVILLNGIASGKRVKLHIIVSKYWLPDFVRGKGPTQSRITCSNGSEDPGTGCNGAGGIT